MSLQDDDRIEVTQIDDISAELERSLTNEWDAKISI
jgi:hypothetical protein